MATYVEDFDNGPGGWMRVVDNYAPIAALPVKDGIVRCPYHGGDFDIRTGAAVEAPCIDPIQAYKAWIEDGRVIAALD